MSPENRRLDLLRGGLACLALAVFLRLLWVQSIAREKYENPTGISYHRRYPLPAQKGDLRDREGRPLARCAEVASIAANPQRVPDPTGAAALLGPLLGREPAELEALLHRRWRPQMLRRDISAALERQLAPLAAAGAIRFTDEPTEPTYGLVVFPRQFQPSPAERAELALVLGVGTADLDALLASESTAIRYQNELDPAVAKRIQQLALSGLLVQENPGRRVRAVWLEPVAAAVVEVPRDPQQPGTLGIDWLVRIRPEIWAALTPVWAGAETPSKSAVEAKLRAPFVYLAREIPRDVGEAIEQLGKTEPVLSGISVHDEARREYPHGELARQILGRVDVDERGISGLELHYNQLLNGVDGYRRVTVSARGKPLVQELEELAPPVHGKHVELTLDVVVQGYAEEALRAAVDENDADWGLAVVVDPGTGEVLAMADAVSGDRDVSLQNRALTVAYEPGSIMKPLVVASAIEAQLTGPNEQFHCAGRTKVGRSTLTCIKAHGAETVAEAVRDSCNMVMIKLAERMGQAKLRRGFETYGLFERTGLGPETQEAVGNIFEHSEDGRWSLQKVATVAYGKGIQCTAVELIRAYSAVLNGGSLPTLHMVRRIRDREGGTLVEQPIQRGRRVLSESTCRQVRAMLREVVADKRGTGHVAESKLFDLAGKTGTSIAYDADDQRIVSFIAYAPYDQPRLLCLVSIAEPRQGQRYGSTTCGPAARSILEQSLQYLGLAPHPVGADKAAP